MSIELDFIKKQCLAYAKVVSFIPPFEVTKETRDKVNAMALHKLMDTMKALATQEWYLGYAEGYVQCHENALERVKKLK